jgi:hypothetical protein
MTDTTRERADIVDALTLTPDDWWNLQGEAEAWRRCPA